MLLKKLKLQNIRSYEELEIKFPKGSVLLAGDIGSGKTSILLGLQFALFGLQPGQKGSSILRQGFDNAYAMLELEVEGEIIVLERTIKKAKNNSISQDSNIITIGEVREELSTSEMKDRVIRILNYPKEFIKKSNLLYKFTVYTPQEEMKSIIQEKPEVRLGTLRHIFGIDRYKRIKENSNIFLQKLKDAIKIKEVLVIELNLLKEKFTLENEKKITLARETNNLNLECKELIRKREESEEKLKAMLEKIEEEKIVDSKISRINVLLEGKSELESRIKREIISMQKQAGEEINFSEERLRFVHELLEKHKGILEEKNFLFLEINSEISGLNSKKERPLELKEKVISLDNCPTCFQAVCLEHKEKISKRTGFEIEEINRELEQKIIQKDFIKKEIKVEIDLIKGYELDKSNLQKDKIRFEHQITIQTKIKSDAFVIERTLNEIEDLKKELEELKKGYLLFENSSGIFEKLKRIFQEINAETRIKEINLAKKEKELELIKVRLEEISLEIKEKEKIREEINYLRSLQDWIQEKFITMINLTEKNVMAKLRNEFSSIFNEWFSILASNSLSVRLDEDFTPIITNQDYELEYDFLSGGERTAVALAYRLSLNKVLNSMLSNIKTKNIVILDEPTEGFATEQIDKMRDIFEQLNSEQTILVSHEQKMEGFVDHVIRIKKDNISFIE
jgi:exonuclease SbcC|tara:strand:- start:865 stop:2907 length:2043 start_codon:yes stop_codon:yes gene_type:complete